MDRQLLADILRNAKGVAETGRAIVQPMIGDIPAGLTGLGSMIAGESMDKAADRTNQVRSQFEYQPSADADKYLQGIGRGAQWVGDKLKSLPGAEQVQQGWEGFTQKAPAIAAVTAGVAGVADPTHGGGKVARVADDAARIAALRAVRESTPAGPVFVSAVEEAIPTLQPKGTLGQYVATLRNKPGIKGEELDDLGLTKMDPNQPVTREQFGEWIGQLRAPRTQMRRSGKDIPPEALDEKVDSLFSDRMAGLANNRKVFDESGAAMPEGLQHPEDRRMALLEQRKQEWYETAFEEHLDNAMTAAERRRPDLAKAAEENDDALEELHDIADGIIEDARTSRRAFGELMGYRDPDDAIWEAHQKQFGNPRANDPKDVEAFTAALRGNIPFLKEWQKKTRAEVLANPQEYRWPDDVPAPKYEYMNYYSDVDKNTDYAELLEQQGQMPSSPDPRGYSEPHWGGGQSNPNDITLHARVNEVKTPEGTRAMLLNELQSKYAADVGGVGTTAQPHQLLDVQEYAAREGQKIRKLIEGDDEDALMMELNNMDPALADTIRHTINAADLTPQAKKEFIDDALMEYETQLADQTRTSHGDSEYMLYNPAIGMPVEAAGHGGQGNWGRGFKTREEAQAASDLMQQGQTPATAGTGADPFKGDRRLPPRAGLKSWRLRGLKMALREAADRGLNDLYLPTGDMMPRIENWTDDMGFEEIDTVIDRRDGTRSKATRADQDQWAAERALDAEENDPDMSFGAVMRNYEERLPKEFAPYLKKFGAKIEEDMMLPLKNKPSAGRVARRVKFTPELLAEVLRGQKLYQVGGGAALLGLLAQQQNEQSEL